MRKLLFVRRSAVDKPKGQPPESMLEDLQRNVGVIKPAEGRAEPVLTVEVNKATKEGTPTHISLNGKIFQLVERTVSDYQKNFGWIYHSLLKVADKVIEKYGIGIALKVAKLDSQVDIAISSVMFAAYGLFISGITAGLVFLGLNGKLGWALNLLKDPSNNSTLWSDLKFIVIATACVGIGSLLLKILDDAQRVLINKLKHKLEIKYPEKYHGFLDLEREFREYDDAERIEGGTVASIIGSIPVINFLAEPLIRAYYSIKYERRQLEAVKKMKVYLADVIAEENHKMK